MSPISATAVGFRLLFRRPLIPLAEIAWRWTFAFAAWLLGIAFVFEYFGSLPVTKADQFLLDSGQPFLIAQSIRRIFHGSSVRFVEAGIVLSLALACAWIVLASLGRLAGLRAMFEDLGRNAEARSSLGALFFLNFLRVAAVLAAKVTAIGSVLIASSLWSSTHIRPVDAAKLVFVIWLCIWLTWAVLNWLLSAAAIFVVAEGKDSLNSIGAMLHLVQSRTPGVLGASAIFGLVHLGALLVAAGTVLVLLPIAIARPIASPLVFAVVVVYCLLADLLYTGRLAAYSYLATGREELPSRTVGPVAPAPGLIGALSPSTSIDKDELILGDLPSPA